MESIGHLAGVDWPVWAVVLAMKTAGLVGLGLLLAWVLRRHDARMRRPVWIVVFATVLLLPAARFIAPSWNFPILPTASSSTADARSGGMPLASSTHLSDPQRPTAPNTTGERAIAEESRGALGVNKQDVARSAFAQQGERALDRTAYILLLVWIVGSAIALAGLLLGIARSDRQVRRGQPVLDRRWHSELDRLRVQLGIRRKVRLAAAASAAVPMTGGVIRPVIILPLSAPTWNAQRIRVVLLHELIHIRRNDWLIDLIGRIGRAMYWFNPLMWIALRDWRLVCEQGCDALVVGNGTKASSYAHLLMELAEEAGQRNRAWPFSLAMARRHLLEERLMTILQPPIKTPKGFATLPLISVLLMTTITAAVTIQPVRRPSQEDADEPESYFLKWGEIGTFHGSLSSYDDGFVRFVGDHHEGKLVVQQELDDDIRFVLRESGEVEYSGGDNETRSMGNDVAPEIVSMAGDARVRMATELDGVAFQLEVLPDEEGRPSYEFAVNGKPRRFDDNAREWMETMFSVAEDIRDIQEIRFEVMNLNGKISQLNHRRSRLQHEIHEIQREEHRLRIEAAGGMGERSKSFVQLANVVAARAELRDRIRHLREEDPDADVLDLEEKLVNLEVIASDVKDMLLSEDASIDGRAAELDQEILDLNTQQRVADVEQQILALETDHRIAGVEAAIEAVNADERIEAIKSMMTPKYDQLRDIIYDDALRYLSVDIAVSEIDLEDTASAKQLPKGRGHSLEKRSRKENVEDDWDRYVREFIEEHSLDESRAERARIILSTSKKMRDRVRKNGKARLKATDAEHKEAVEKRVQSQIDRVFQRVLVRNLEALLGKGEGGQ